MNQIHRNTKSDFREDGELINTALSLMGFDYVWASNGRILFSSY